MLRRFLVFLVSAAVVAGLFTVGTASATTASAVGAVESSSRAATVPAPAPAVAASVPAAGGAVVRASVGEDGELAEGGDEGAISGDGSRVAFNSESDDVVPGDNNGGLDVFVRDLDSGEVWMASTTADGTPGDEFSEAPAISHDGHLVAFHSNSTNLVPGTNIRTDVYVKDLDTGQLVLASADADGVPGDDSSTWPSMSASGSRVVFNTDASNLSGSSTGQVVVKDLVTGTVTLASAGAGGEPANGWTGNPVLSPDGKKVLFESRATNLDPQAANGDAQVFVKDLDSGGIQLASAASDGTVADGQSSTGSLSGDGSVAAFSSRGTNLDGSTGNTAVFVKDFGSGQVRAVAKTAQGQPTGWSSTTPFLSADGRKVAFRSWGGGPSILHKDLDTGELLIVPSTASGVEANSGSGLGYSGGISSDGSKVVFSSSATNLIDDDTNSKSDVFVKSVEAPVAATVGVADVREVRSTANRCSPCVVTDPATGRSIDYDPFTAHPVDKRTGAKSETAIDIALPGRFPISWTRNYSSQQADQSWANGHGWATGFQEAIRVDEEAGTVSVVTENGGLTVFTDNEDGTFSAPEYTLATLTQDTESGNWTYILDHQYTYEFNPAGQLVSVADSTGETITTSFDSDDRLTSITSPDGRALTLAYQPGSPLVETITGPDGVSITYGYDNNADLTSVQDAQGRTWAYEYDGQHLLTSITAPGEEPKTVTYDGQNRVTQQSGPWSSNPETFTYEDTQTSDGSNQLVTTHTDSTGVTTRYTYVNHWLTIREIAPDTEHVSLDQFTYNASGGVTQWVGPNGQSTLTEFDDDGNPTQVTDPSGEVATMAWDNNRQLTGETRANGQTLTYEYDEHRNLIQQTATRDGSTTATSTWTHDPAHPGDLVAETDPRGNATTYAYDTTGLVSERTDPLGRVITTSRNSYGLPVAATDPSGATASYEYNNHLELASQTSPTGDTTSYTFSDSGQVASVTNGRGDVISYEYDAAGRRVSTTNGEGEAVTTQYDGADQPLTLTGPDGGVTSWAYDDHGRVSTKTSPAPAGHSNGPVTSNTYDQSGRLVAQSVPDPGTGDPITTSWQFDPVGRITRTTDPKGHASSVEYSTSSSGRSITTTNQLGGTATQQFDHADQLTTTTNPYSKVSTHAYDLAGNRTASTTPTGRTTRYEYDQANQLVATVDPRGTTATADPAKYTTTHSFDHVARTLTTTSPLGKATINTFDPNGRLASVTDGRGNTTDYTYDGANNLTSVIAPESTTAHAYDHAGRRISTTDPNGGVHTVDHQYGEQSSETIRTDAAGRTVTDKFDAAGNLTSQQVARGTITNTYDQLSRLTDTNYSDATTPTAYKYDPAGQVTQVKDATGTTTVRYNKAGQLRLWRNGDQEWAYTHRKDGKPKKTTTPTGEIKQWAYNADSRPTKLTSNSGITKFGYNKAGLISKITYPTGLTQTTGINRDTLPSRIRLQNEAETLKDYRLSYDQANNLTRVRLTTGSDLESRRYRYDPMNRLTDECLIPGTLDSPTCKTADATSTWVYDPNGNTTSRINEASNTATSYLPGDRVNEQLVDGQDPVTFAYDGDGNLTNDGTTQRAFNLHNTITSQTLDGASTDYVIGADQLRHTATTTGTQQSTWMYQWDRNKSWAQLASLTQTPDGQPPTTTSYDYTPTGAPLAQTTNPDQPDAATSWYGHDWLGSVTSTHTTTTVLDTNTEYTPYGNPRGPPTTTPGFAHTLTNPGPGTSVHLRARDYNPTTGTLTSLDPRGQQGSSTPTGAWNSPYNYTPNNPLTNIDPTGLEFQWWNTGTWSDNDSPNPLQTGYGFISSFTDAANQAIRCVEGKCLDDIKQVIENYQYKANDQGHQMALWDLTPIPQCADAFTGTSATPMGHCVGNLATLAFGAGAIKSLLKPKTKQALDDCALKKTGGEAIPWTSWPNYPKVVQGGREYAQVGNRRYTRHAVDRMQPSGLGAPAGASGPGRSISPNFVEDVLTNSRGVSVKGPNGEPRMSFESGTVQVITESNIVVTVITR